MIKLLNEIKHCEICKTHLEFGVNPVVTVNVNSKIVVIGQAPGRQVHESGIPWDDQSGENLRNWLGVDKDDFYQTDKFAIIPMSFCYPGKGKSGDLPPRRECAPKWHEPLFSGIKNPELILLIGSYAQHYYLGNNAKRTLTETVKAYKSYLPKFFVLPHPSPRNNIWQAKNEWFKEDVLPSLKAKVTDIL